ncbi:MAG: hypothetical protein Q9174_003682 [Haloplaca sp. 1 TL-2023]
MGDDYLRIREKENAKEWQIKEDAGVQKGIVHNYFTQYIDEDQMSESGAEDAPPVPIRNQISSRAPAPIRRPVPNVFSKRPIARPAWKPGSKQLITLTLKRDNAAKTSYRNKAGPSRLYDMGTPLREIEPNHTKIYRSLEEIGVRFGSFVLPPRDLRSSKIAIWGDPNQVQLTISELESWRDRSDGSSTGAPSGYSRNQSKDHFAKIGSTISQKYADENAKATRLAQRLKYQKKPANGRKFNSNGYFLWPNDEIRAVDLFGPNCEALDSLRMEFKAYVLFEDARSVFKVHSDKEDSHVNKVLNRIENTIKEYVARDHRPTLLFTVEAPDRYNYQHEVQVVPGPAFGLNRTQSRIPTFLRKKLESSGDGVWENMYFDWCEKNERTMYRAVHDVLDRIPYYRGSIRFSVNYGTFGLTKYHWPPGIESVPQADFAKKIQLSNTRGTLVRDLQLGGSAKDILNHCHQARDVFENVDLQAKDLAEATPSYRAMFYLRHPEKAEEVLELDVRFKPNEAEPGLFETSKAVWRRCGKPDVLSQAPPLEMFSIRLYSGISWELKISTENVLDATRITPQMDLFVRNIQFKKPPSDQKPALSGYRVVTRPSNLRVLGFEQKTSFRWSLKLQPQFIFELSRNDEYNGENPWLPSSTQWAATLHDREWDRKLGANETLDVGEEAEWDPQIDHFFEPMTTTSNDPLAGFHDFLLHAKSVGTFLDGLKMESDESARRMKGEKQDEQ